MKLAERADLSVGYICDLEAGRRWGTLETFTKLANAFGVSPFELLIPDTSANEQTYTESAALSKAMKRHVAKIEKALRKNVSTTITETLYEFLV